MCPSNSLAFYISKFALWMKTAHGLLFTPFLLPGLNHPKWGSQGVMFLSHPGISFQISSSERLSLTCLSWLTHFVIYRICHYCH